MDKNWGRDKGGGSFKMSLQLGNVEHPNSINNTFVFACFEAHDYVTSTHVQCVYYCRCFCCMCSRYV